MAIPELIAALDSHTNQFGPYDLHTIAVVNELAVALWQAGDSDQAVRLLVQALDGLGPRGVEEDSVRLNLLCTLGEIMVEQCRMAQARTVYREVFDLCVRRSGECHPSSLAAKGDLAFVLFSLGETTEAAHMEEQAITDARIHLGDRHPVTCVLAWNRALRYDLSGDSNAAQEIVRNELAWLLTEPDDHLEPDQQTIRDILAKRLNWDAATVC
jgi:hypothetical protein